MACVCGCERCFHGELELHILGIGGSQCDILFLPTKVLSVDHRGVVHGLGLHDWLRLGRLGAELGRKLLLGSGHFNLTVVSVHAAASFGIGDGDGLCFKVGFS